MSLINRIVFLGVFLMYSAEAVAQRYHFEQLDIEDGLAQSQVTAIVQDGKRKLWIATLGGLSCYNGNRFITYTKTDGMNGNFILSLSPGNQNNLWIGTAVGLSKFDGQQFYNYRDANKWTSKVVTDKQSNTYAIIYRKLHRISARHTSQVSITNEKNEKITALDKDFNGQLWAAVYNKGTYHLQDGHWKKHPMFLDNDIIITHILSDRFLKEKIWLVTDQGLYVYQEGRTTKFARGIKEKIMAIVQDHDQNIWIGTNNGAYRITPDEKNTHFNKSNGLTDNQVNSIFIDIEKNIWFATDGSGIFKYNKRSYETFDESQGLKNDIVMAITKGARADEMWLGTYNGLFLLKNNVLTEIPIPSINHDSRKINILFKDHKDNIWIGTPGGGLWLHDGKRIQRIDGGKNLAYNAIIEDSQRRIWLSTNAGNYRVDMPGKTFTKVTDPFSSSLMELAPDSIIAGTQQGVYLIDKQKSIKKIRIRTLEESSVLCMVKHKHLVFFGTADNGLIIWDRSNGKIVKMTTKNGLVSDHIYSLLLDSSAMLWVGTGKGINKIDTRNLRVLKHDLLNLMVECNQNAILSSRNKIWIGTTKGAIVYDQKP